jgi:prevent-host-death family protein
MTRMTATDAARSFSELLNRVADGEQIEVTRSGATVAVISPPRSRLISAERFRELIESAPRPDPGFLGEVRAARESVGAPEDAWPS